MLSLMDLLTYKLVKLQWAGYSRRIFPLDIVKEYYKR